MIAQTLAAFAKSTVRSFSDRGNTVGASEIGQCARKIFFAKNSDDRAYAISVDHDYVDSGGAALRGRLLEENYWLPALRMRFGDKLLYAGNEQSTLCAGFLSATGRLWREGLQIKASACSTIVCVFSFCLRRHTKPTKRTSPGDKASVCTGAIVVLVGRV